MKNIIKLIIIISILGVIASCENTDISKKQTNMNLLAEEQCNMILNLAVNMNQSYVFDEEYEHDISQWENLLKDKYNIDMQLNYISPIYESEFISGSYIIEKIEDKSLEGLIRLQGIQLTNIGALKSEGLILPLDELLMENDGFTNLPMAMKSPFIIDGKLWAIPSGYENTASVRFISKELLEKSNSDIPETLAEYYEVLLNISKIKETIPMVINNDIPYSFTMRDIFYANGCYPSYTGFSSINYDPLTNSVEDYILKPGAIDTYQYLNLLFENKLLQLKNVDNLDEFVKNKNYGSYYNEIKDYKQEYEDDYEIIWYLKGSNDKYLNTILPSKGAYILSRNTQNAKQTVNKFVDTFLLDKEGYYTSYFGEYDKKYYIENEYVVAVSNEKGMNITTPYMEYLSNTNTKFKNSDGVEYYNNIVNINSITTQLLKEDLLFSSSYFPYSFDLRMAGRIHGWFFTNFINRRGEVNIEDLVDMEQKQYTIILIDNLEDIRNIKKSSRI